MIDVAQSPVQIPAEQPTAPAAPTEPAPMTPAAATPATQPTEHLLVPPENRPQPEELVLEWTAPNRPFQKRDKKYFVTIGIILFLISLILFFAGQFILIAVGIAAAFLYYVMSAVPPEQVLNQVTTFGVRTDNQLSNSVIGLANLNSRSSSFIVMLILRIVKLDNVSTSTGRT
jgi:hypothetical protein